MSLRSIAAGLLLWMAALGSQAQTTVPNTPPTISGTPATSIPAGVAYSFTPAARDANGDPLRFYIANKPAWASFNSSSGALTGTPSTAQVGTYSAISIYVSDGRVSSFLPTFSIAVTGSVTAQTTTATQQPPTISGAPATTVGAGSPYFFQPTASDANGDALRFYIANKPAWATFNSSTGALTGTPSTSHVGTWAAVSIYVSDGRVSTFLPAFSISVNGSSTTNRAPTLSGRAPTQATAGSKYHFQPVASDPDGDALSFSISGKPKWATFSVSQGTLSGTPGISDTGNYSNIVITATDGRASASLPAFAVSVTAATSLSGVVTVSWTPPTLTVSGSMLTNLAGYKLYRGTSETSLGDVRLVGANTTSYQYSGLASGTHHFAISSYSSDGRESDLVLVGTRTIP